MLSFRALWQTFCVRLTFYLLLRLFASCCVSFLTFSGLRFIIKAENKGLTFDQLNFVKNENSLE